MVARERISRACQKQRTREAIVAACRELIASGADVTMPAVARSAGVAEATAYRHFPDLVSVVNEALAGLWPTPAEALAPVAEVTDPAARIAFATEFLCRKVLAYQGSVRAVIASTITRPESVPTRPGFRFGLIDEALDPVVPAGERLADLKRDLAAVVSAEALFSLTDLCRLDGDTAIASLVRTAATITRVAADELGGRDLSGS
ncbi:MAG TPA: TetR/AcrR family transcriptional regulator [Pseudonocardiaceae bacterium]|nr:TetR/AcrR family transcriptional regulator [Pseudonocardiaceae bacterium]